ncbi:hypothetical protein ACLOJK_010513 [Asimina triloba]
MNSIKAKRSIKDWYSSATPSNTIEKSTEESVGSKHGGRGQTQSQSQSQSQCTVTCIYQTKIAGLCRIVTVVWGKNIMNNTLHLTVDNPQSENCHYHCKIDLKPWHFWSRKGYKSFDVDGNRLDVYWDLRMAKFSGGSEPSGDYYVAVVCDEEVVLLLGGCKKEAYKRTKSRPSLVDATLLTKKENVFGKRSFFTKTKFDEKKEHEILIENSISAAPEPEMWVSIDGDVLIHVSNLQWKFRGNQMVTVSQGPMQVFWDVHDWLFNSHGPGHALFIFKPGAPPPTEHCREDNGSSHDGGADDEVDGRDLEVQNPHPPAPAEPEFCLFLYAWKVE